MLNYNLLKNEINNIVTDQLPPKCSAIFILSRIDGKSNQEIASLLNISKKTVENQLYHALKIFRKNILKYL